MFRSEWDQLLLAARGGDVHALGRLVEVAGEDLRTVAAAVLGPTTRERIPPEDVFADAMMAVLREIGSLRATSYVGFRYWFASIARNHVRRALRDGRARPDERCEADPEPEDAPFPTIVITDENEAFVRYALVRLPRNQQIAFVLREGLGLAWRTIGFVLERRASPAARLIHYRAVRHVKAVAGTHAGLRLSAIRA